MWPFCDTNYTTNIMQKVESVIGERQKTHTHTHREMSYKSWVIFQDNKIAASGIVFSIWTSMGGKNQQPFLAHGDLGFSPDSGDGQEQPTGQQRYWCLTDLKMKMCLTLEWPKSEVATCPQVSLRLHREQFLPWYSHSCLLLLPSLSWYKAQIPPQVVAFPSWS